MENQSFFDAGFWGLIGVVVGFGLGEISRAIKNISKARKYKKVIREELKAVSEQIPVLFDSISNIRDQILNNEAPKGFHNLVISVGYHKLFPEVYHLYDANERLCILGIYQSVSLISQSIENHREIVINQVHLLPHPEAIEVHDEIIKFLGFLQIMLKETQVRLDLYLDGRIAECYAAMGGKN